MFFHGGFQDRSCAILGFNSSHNQRSLYLWVLRILRLYHPQFALAGCNCAMPFLQMVSIGAAADCLPNEMAEVAAGGGSVDCLLWWHRPLQVQPVSLLLGHHPQQLPRLLLCQHVLCTCTQPTSVTDAELCTSLSRTAWAMHCLQEAC